MTKLLRKHGKVLLAFFSSILMIVFILPSAFKNARDITNLETGRLAGKKILNRDLSGAAYDMHILSAFRFGVQDYDGKFLPVSLLQRLITGAPSRALYGMYRIGPSVPLTDLEDLRSTHWFLLLEEARRYGINPSDEEVAGVVASLNLSEEDMAAALKAIDQGIPQKFLLDAIRDALMIQRLGQLAALTPSVALPEVEFFADQVLSRIQISYATLDGIKDWQTSPPPSEELIIRQFELYKNLLPTALDSPVMPQLVDGHTYPFGYRYPDRVKIEYLRFERSDITRLFKPTREDDEAALRYYNKHPEEFRTAKESGFGLSTQPATRPFEDVREQLIEKQISQRVDKLLRKAADRAVTLAGEPWKNVATNEEGYRASLPPEQWADYDKIANDIASNKDFGGFRPAHVTLTGFQSASDLAKLPGIGKAYVTLNNAVAPFPQLATHVKELVGTKSKDQFGRFFLQVGLEAPLLADETGNLYLYRVTAGDTSHVPATVAEVRSQVLEDLRKITSYQNTQVRARELASLATAGDLAAIIKSKDKDIPVDNVKDLTQLGESGAQVRSIPGFIDAAFALTREPAATQPVKEGKRVSATTTLAKDNSLRVYVIELISYTPASPVEFTVERSQVARSVVQNDRRRFRDSWLSLQVVADRLQFVPAQPFRTKKTEEEN